MNRIRLSDLVSAVKGELVGGFTDLSVEIADVSTDSRNIISESVFFALVGDRFDGHRYLAQAVEGGAKGCVISEKVEEYAEGAFYVLVDDTEKALGDLAKWYRSLFDIPAVAVTGSVGKTTAKDMISSVLSTKYQVLKTEGNYNNGIGLPLTVFGLSKQHQVCVLEMGMDTPGDIDYLANIVKPDIAVLTNIGDAHVERLGSRENIFKAKSEVLPHVKSDGLVILNGDDSFLPRITGDFRVITVGQGEGLDYRGTDLQGDGVSSISFQFVGSAEECKVNVPAMGDHMMYPALLSIATGIALKVEISEILKGISQFTPTKMRMNQRVLPGNITLLDDTYNANPQSMEAGLGVLGNHFTHRKVAVLGDMLELGDFSEELHRKIGTVARKSKISTLISVGEQAKFIAEEAAKGGIPRVVHARDNEEAKTLLAQEILPETVLFFKASRGMALEELVKFTNDYVK